jgi:hypothetical protein
MVPPSCIQLVRRQALVPALHGLWFAGAIMSWPHDDVAGAAEHLLFSYAARAPQLQNTTVSPG